MSHRQKNTHKSRHHRHAVQPANLPLPELGLEGQEASTLMPPPPLSAEVGEVSAEEEIVTQVEAGRP